MPVANRNKNRIMLRKLVLTAMLSALVILLQLIGAFIHFGVFSITLTLVPIVVGAAICGPWAGAFLGLVFGATVLLSGDAAFFLAFNPAGTVFIVLAKGILCGLVSGLVYRALCTVFRKKSVGETVGGIASSVICPIMNTGVFFVGCLVFFRGLIEGQEGYSGSVAMYAILYFIGANFIVELLINSALGFAIVRLIALGKKTLGLEEGSDQLIRRKEDK